MLRLVQSQGAAIAPYRRKGVAGPGDLTHRVELSSDLTVPSTANIAHPWMALEENKMEWWVEMEWWRWSGGVGVVELEWWRWSGGAGVPVPMKLTLS